MPPWRGGALGARITGGGFGGSIIALVGDADAERIAQAMLDATRQAGTPEPQLHLAIAAGPGQRLS